MHQRGWRKVRTRRTERTEIVKKREGKREKRRTTDRETDREGVRSAEEHTLAFASTWYTGPTP